MRDVVQASNLPANYSYPNKTWTHWLDHVLLYQSLAVGIVSMHAKVNGKVTEFGGN